MKTILKVVLLDPRHLARILLMPDVEPDPVPMVALLLDRVRRVGEDEVRALVTAELGEEAAATITVIGDFESGMSYTTWRAGRVPYNLGTSSSRCISLVEREELPPDQEDHCEAWTRHNAWLYVDALCFVDRNADAEHHRQNVFRLAGRLIDSRCVLVWYVPALPKKVVALPTKETIAALRSGVWSV